MADPQSQTIPHPLELTPSDDNTPSQQPQPQNGIAGETGTTHGSGDGKGPHWIGDNLPSLPEYLQYAQSLAPKVTDKYVLFFGFEGPEPECALQQWYRSTFVTKDEKTGEERKFGTAEQYMMWQKALLMGDEETAGRTLKAEGPGEAKGLGREVTGFKQEIWDRECDRVVEEGQVLKFGQDERLKKILLGTGEREIVSHEVPWCSIRDLGDT